MATPVQPPTIAHLSQAAAHQLQILHQQQLSEKIFADAVAAIKKELKDSESKNSKPSPGPSSKETLLAKLASLRDITGVEQLVDAEVNNSAIWGSNAKISPDGRFQKLLSYVTRFKEIVGSIASAAEPTVAAPVWGVICFILTVAQEVPKIHESIQDILELAKASAKAFNEYFMNTKRPTLAEDSPLRGALQYFYYVLVKGALDISPLLSSRARGLMSITDGSATTIVSDLKSKLMKAEERVFRYGSSHQNNELSDKLDGLKMSQGQSHARTAPTHGHRFLIPHMLNPHFAGRDTVLRSIASRLAALPVGATPRTVALCGMPGVGKTQTAIAYARSTTSLLGTTDYTHTMIVRARDASTLQVDLIQLAERVLVYQPSDRGNDAIMQKFSVWLETADKWLLIVDDAVDTNILMDRLPAIGNGDILYTTRSPETAKLLCGKDNVIEVDCMTDAESHDMLQSMFKDSICVTSKTDEDEAIKQITAFCHGLPLVMEQLVNTAKYREAPWAEELARVKHKRDLLRHKAINGFHFDDRLKDHSGGAVLISGLDGLKEGGQGAMAYALFFVLAYLEPSSIPFKMIMQGGGHLDEWFGRLTTYDRGCKRTRRGDDIVRDAQIQGRSTYLPSHSGRPDLRDRLRAVFRRGSGRQVHMLSRADSGHDVSLQDYWQSSDDLRMALSTEANLATALNSIITTGLVKRITSDTLSIHDLYAELTTAYVEADLNQAHPPSTTPPNPRAHNNTNISAQHTMHLSATLVYLAFPPLLTRDFSSTDTCLSLLSHAEASLRHLSDARILADTTVGAELSHIAGCATDFRVLRDRVAPQHGAGGAVAGTGTLTLDKERAEASLPYFRTAHSCYAAAAKRLVARELALVSSSSAYRYKSPAWVLRKRIARAVRDEYALEEAAQAQTGQKGWMYYVNNRHASEYERFGSDPVRRRMDSLLKLGVMCRLAGRVDEAIAYMKVAVRDYEALLGGRHQLVESAREMLLTLYIREGRWEEGLEVIGQRYRASMLAGYHRSTVRKRGIGDWALMVDLAVVLPHLADDAAQCLIGLGRLDEAVRLFEVLYMQAERQFGVDSVGNIPWARSLATTYGRMEQWGRCVFWWCVAFGLVFGAEDADAVVDEHGDGDGDGGVSGIREYGEVASQGIGLDVLEEEGWWLKDAYRSQRELEEERRMWGYAVRKWREGLVHPSSQNEHSGLSALVGKIELDLMQWTRRMAERKRREKRREMMELEAAMEEYGAKTDRTDSS